MQDMLGQVLYTSFKEEVSAYQACLYLYPDVCLHYCDEYTAALVKAIDMQENIGTIFVVTGTGQSRSIPHYMAQSPKSLADVTQQKPVYESLIQRDSAEIQIDKLVAFDLMMGPLYTQLTVIDNVSITTAKVIK
jgi:hypothetical protein